MFSTSKSVDFVLLGAGIASCCLAIELEEAGASVVLIDDGRKASTRVAGGVMNPVSGKRFGIDPGFGEAKALAKVRYESIAPVWRDIELLRVLSESDEQAHFAKKANFLSESSMVRSVDPQEFRSRVSQSLVESLNSPAICISNAAVVDLSKLLDAYHARFAASGVLMQMSAEEARRSVQDLQFQGHRIRGVVCCEGWRIGENPWFRYVPRMFARGQVLELDFEGPHGLSDIVILHSKFLLPLDERRCLYGATYEWNDVHDQESAETTDFLLHQFCASYLARPRLLSVRAGVRPIVKDLKPVLGEHPQRPGFFLFNGLGSKAALQAPHCARMLAHHILHNHDLPDALSLQRFNAFLESTEG